MDIKQKCIETLGQVSTLVNAKAPMTPSPPRGGCATSASAWPRPPMKGGFLGIGGVQVSEAEKAMLAEISSALGLPL
jgi:hypothetical protein